MDITSCTKADYDQIITHIQEFWGGDRTLNLHHPMFVYEFGNSVYIIKDGNQVAAYLFGFISQTESTAYVHLVGVRESYRRRGLARRLYDHFVRFALSEGCTEPKAITTPSNKESIAFHRSAGSHQRLCRPRAGPGGISKNIDVGGRRPTKPFHRP